jgi:hypothetical protein
VEKGRTDACPGVEEGFIVLGGTTAVEVPEGSHLIECNNDGKQCQKFQQCPQGWTGEDPPTITCIECLAGETSSTGSPEGSCRACAKGRFSTSKGAENCTACPENWYQPQDKTLSVQCKECPDGYSQGKEGESSCIGQGYIKPEACTSSLNLQCSVLFCLHNCLTSVYCFFILTSHLLYSFCTGSNEEYWIPNKKGQPGCVDCPPGGSCTGPITVTGIRTLFGWSKCPTSSNNLTHERCVFGAACNGAPNKLLKNKFKDEINNIDPALEDRNASCSAAFQNNSLLCAACASGFSHSGLGDTCEKCPDPGANLAIAVAGVVVGFAGLFIFVQIILSDKGKIDPADGAKSIGLSFIQILSLLSTFPIAWPQLFVTLFRIGSAVAVMGQHLVNFKCMYPLQSEAQVFYLGRIIGAILPIVISLICVLLWLIAARCKIIIELESKMKASVVAILFLQWPGLCSQTFSIFSCREVCGQNLLRADLDETCWGDWGTRHTSYAFYLGVPMVVLYVLGLPGVAFFNVWRTQRRSSTRGAKIETLKGHLTWGLFYSAYDPKVWFWEMTVALRKITIAFLGVFGASMGEMQVHLTAWGMVCVIVMTAVVRPFGERTLLQYLEMGTLLATWMTLWAGTVFNAYPRCEKSDGQGGTEGWCDFLSVVIGILNVVMVVAVIVVIVFYTKQKKCFACFEEMRDKTIGKWRRKKKTRHEREMRSRFEAADVSSFVNPNLDAQTVLDTQELSIELTTTVGIVGSDGSDGGSDGSDSSDGSNGSVEVPTWDRFLDESSHRYYLYNGLTGETKWENEVEDEAEEVEDEEE